METQSDFLNNLDTGQPISVTKKKPSKQIELDILLEEKDKLSERIDRCPVCEEGDKHRCGNGHPQDWALLLEKIKLLEGEIASL